MNIGVSQSTHNQFHRTTGNFYSSDPSRDSHTAQVEQFCQRWLAQIAGQVGNSHLWLGYVDPGSQQFRQLRLPQGNLPLDPMTEQDWKAVSFQVRSLPPLQVTDLTDFSDDRVCHTYGCRLHPLEPLEYLVLRLAAPLPLPQQAWLTGELHLLQDYLCLGRECYRQQSISTALQQSIQKTQHQLRSPLALLEIYTSLLSMQLPEGEARSQVVQMQAVVQELGTHLKALACHQTSRLQLEWHDLRGILADSLKGLQPWLAEKQIQLQIGTTPIWLRVDPWQLKQVFDNLLDNAIHFSPPSGAIACNWRVFQQEVLVTPSPPFIPGGRAERDWDWRSPRKSSWITTVASGATTCQDGERNFPLACRDNPASIFHRPVHHRSCSTVMLCPSIKPIPPSVFPASRRFLPCWWMMNPNFARDSIPC